MLAAQAFKNWNCLAQGNGAKLTATALHFAETESRYQSRKTDMRIVVALLLATCGLILIPSSSRGASPEETVESVKLCLEEALANPAKRIPEKMLADAHAVAIIPNVIKIGFIGAVRRGHGVVLIRDKEGDWGLPQFITITGGSVGWQAGAQSSDVVLVFRTERSVENLMKGKFTLGADAAIAAGPVGRRVEAATDAALKAEILSYARSRGLFAGVSLDGSALEVDDFAHRSFYGSASSELPRQIPQSATKLVAYVAALTGGKEAAAGELPIAATGETANLRVLQSQLAKADTQLNVILDAKWREYLVLPADVFDSQRIPNEQDLGASLAKFDTIAQSASYAKLASRSEFQAAHELLREMTNAVAASQRSHVVSLPPPPMVVPQGNRR
jgi:lipid-binding SYLF domain-containing protein